MKSHSQFIGYSQLIFQIDVHNEIKLLTILFGQTYRCLDRVVPKKGGQGQKLLCIEKVECKVVLLDAKSLFHTLHLKVNTINQHYNSRHI